MISVEVLFQDQLNQNKTKVGKEVLYFGKWFTHYFYLIWVIFQKWSPVLWFEGEVMDGEVKWNSKRVNRMKYMCGFIHTT